MRALCPPVAPAPTADANARSGRRACNPSRSESVRSGLAPRSSLVFLACAARDLGGRVHCRTRPTCWPTGCTWARRSAAFLLAVATNLPEIAITASAAVAGNIGVAVGNILGGIAIQTVVLVALDAFGVRGPRPLTYRAASLVLVLEGALVVASSRSSWRAASSPSDLIALRLTPGAGADRRAVGGRAAAAAASRQACPGTSRARPRQPGRAARHPAAARAGRDRTGRQHRQAATIFGVAALLTLVAGVVLERSGDAIAGHVGLSGVLFGATVLAAATSLPEVSTG